MKLPNGDEAIIPAEKLMGYCLDPNHPDGKNKAYLFDRLLGITQANWTDLRDILKTAARESPVIATQTTTHGEIYYLDTEVQRTSRTFIIRSLWLLRTSEIIPRLVSSYVRRSKRNGT